MRKASRAFKTFQLLWWSSVICFPLVWRTGFDSTESPPAFWCCVGRWSTWVMQNRWSLVWSSPSFQQSKWDDFIIPPVPYLSGWTCCWKCAQGSGICCWPLALCGGSGAGICGCSATATLPLFGTAARSLWSELEFDWVFKENLKLI